MRIKIILSFILLCFTGLISAQPITPAISFNDDPDSYNMHIASDGNFYYTVNGGVPEQGKISKFTLQGQRLQTYPIKLDMRSIMYNKKDKSLYINTNTKEIYKVIDLASGTIELLYQANYDNEQSALALDPRGKYLYAMDNGKLAVYKFSSGEPERVISGLKCGDGSKKGSTTVAVDNKYIYTWDATKKTIYVYDLEGIFVRSYVVKDGDFGYSLSIANDLVFVAKSVKDRTGTWYGYMLAP